jgi:hypothetical protein
VGDHSASAPCLAKTTSGTLSLFVDDYGLAFEALIDMDDRSNWGRVRGMTCRDNPSAFASVGGLIINSKRTATLSGGVSGDLITDATIDHISVCGADAVYRGTGVWPEGPLDLAPSKIWALNERWIAGRAQWDAAQRRSATTRPAARIVNIKSTVGMSKVQAAAVLASRYDEFAKYRRAAMAAFNAGRLRGSDVFGHVAFTRAGGFQQDPPPVANGIEQL